MPKLTAVITAYNRAEFIGKCVASLLDAATPDLHIHVIVMDNGSSDGTGEAAQAMGEAVQVLHTDDNQPLPGVLNRGLRLALEDACVDYVMTMNDDTAFRPGSLMALVEACDQEPTGLLTPLQINYRDPEHLDLLALGNVKSVDSLVEDAVLGRPLKKAYPIKTIIGAAMIGRAEVWRNVGEFDELFWFYGIDDDYCTRARWLGYEVFIAPCSHLLHAHGKLGEKGDKVATWTNPAVRWRKELQTRYMFRMKEQSRPLWWCTVSTIAYCFQTSAACAIKLWPRGTVDSWVVLADCLIKLPRIAEARRSHYDPRRKL